ncbi:MAG: hypothetical protein LQ351_002424 [Letrouitia transgressa]|nr:MAG: hypothetical protein LQ351_002424 [Letrouitia transgressa]
MNVGKAPACVPTWRGHVETTKDALLIFEACFTGTLAHCFRRPHDRERSQLIVSGNVFVYEEATSGIKRWTDGIPWSPSRILTNFLIYRQLNSPFPPGEKKRATKRSQRVQKPGDPYPTPTPSTSTNDDYTSPFSPESPGLKSDEGLDKDGDRGLVGSLVDSYEFKEKGLLKKTMTVTINNVQHHLVSYYSLEDAKHNLKTPRDDPRLKDLPLRPELLHQPKFKFSNFDDAGDGAFEQFDPPQHGFTYLPNGYDQLRHFSASNQGHPHRAESSQQYYYPGVSQYMAPAPNSAISYASIPPNTTTFAPTASLSTSFTSQQAPGLHGQYPQHQHQTQNTQNQAQHAHYQMQASAPSQLSSPTHQVQPPNSQQYPVHATLPKPNGMFDSPGMSQDSAGMHHNIYEPFSSAPTSLNHAMMSYPGISQLPTGYVSSPQQYSARNDGPAQTYRAF